MRLADLDVACRTSAGNNRTANEPLFTDSLLQPGFRILSAYVYARSKYWPIASIAVANADNMNLKGLRHQST